MALKLTFTFIPASPVTAMLQWRRSPKKPSALGDTYIFTEHYDPDFVYQPANPVLFELNTDSYLYDLLDSGKNIMVEFESCSV